MSEREDRNGDVRMRERSNSNSPDFHRRPRSVSRSPDGRRPRGGRDRSRSPRGLHQPIIHAQLIPRILQPGTLKSESEGTETRRIIIPQYIRPWPIPIRILKSFLILPLTLQGLYRRLLSIDFLNRTKLINIPRISDIDAALTSASSGMPYTYERLETLGDSYLKMHLSCHLFSHLPKCHEGFLSRYRTIKERNLALVKKVQNRVRISDSILVERVSRRYWRPLFRKYEISPMKESKLILNDDLEVDYMDLNSDEEMYDAEKNELLSTPVFEKLQQRISDHTIADCVEAVIGACVYNGGCNGGAAAMRCLLDDDYKGNWSESYFKMIMDGYSKVITTLDDITKSPTDNTLEILKHQNFEIVDQAEKLIGYKFRYPVLLFEAVTHPSSVELSKSFERLEFLGDSILGFVVMRFLYHRYPEKDPHQLSWMRSSLVSNQTLACVSAHLGLHELLNHSSMSLSAAIDRFERDLKEFLKDYQYKIENNIPVPKDRHGTLLNVPLSVKCPPKAVSDIYEALLGAVFVDSGCNVEVCWNVVKNTLFKSPWMLLKGNARVTKSIFSEKTHFQAWMNDIYPGLVGIMVPPQDQSTINILDVIVSRLKCQKMRLM
ncbi:Dicer-2, isoform A [Nowakowskiella sp. JEL0078]|nr:Dicer-2, isoform A [Nowakowskiella sp. JEL0078]